MPPIVVFALQALFLVLLYLFVARAVRAVIRDVRTAEAPSRRATSPPQAKPPPAAPGRSAQAGQLVVHRPDGRPEVVALDGSEIRFGRDHDCDVVLNDTYTSARHARVFPRQGTWMVADMGSTNGTFLNRERVADPAPINPGDQVTIGKTIVEVRK